MIWLICNEGLWFLRRYPPEDCGREGRFEIFEELTVFLPLIMRNLIYNVLNNNQFKSMGTTPANSLLQEYNIESTNGNTKILSKKTNETEKYIMKSYTTTNVEEHHQKVVYFQQYQANMDSNHEMTKLVRIEQEKEEHFCTSSYKLHLIFEYSSFNIGKEMNERKNDLFKTYHKHRVETRYFNYEDLCNILYSCLSALWLTKECNDSSQPDRELSRFGNMFISTENILIFGEGVIKIMDPFITGFTNRYNFTKKVYYSPEKLAQFHIVDDEKCAIFELGMTLLELSLLEPLYSAYQQHEFIQEVVAKRLMRARHVYSSDIENILSVSVFDLIERMVESDRDERFSLQEAIKYAEDMYEVNESVAQETNRPNTAKFYHSNEKKRAMIETNHSTSGKDSSGKKSFHAFKTSRIQDRTDDFPELILKSPKISNFTIHEVYPQYEQQSSMLQSLTVNNPPKNDINHSLVQGGIFSTLNIGDSYNYSKHNLPPPSTPRSVLEMNPKPQQIFTDPQLLKTIHRELREMQSRKKQRERNGLFESSVLERKDRYDMGQKLRSTLKITNVVYLDR